MHTTFAQPEVFPTDGAIDGEFNFLDLELGVDEDFDVEDSELLDPCAC